MKTEFESEIKGLLHRDLVRRAQLHDLYNILPWWAWRRRRVIRQEIDRVDHATTVWYDVLKPAPPTEKL